MSQAHTDDDSSDENEGSMQSSGSEEWSVKNQKKRAKRHGHKSHSKSKRSSKKRKSTRRKLNDVQEENAADDSKNAGSDCSIAELKDDVKLEVLSDDYSAISDINPPSLFTRLRRKRQERRESGKLKSASSTSSAVDSDGRKAKSEPILITLDSDSDADDVTMVAGRPNRTARVQGEIIRKFGRPSHSTMSSSKCSESSSSTDYEKKKSKKGKKKLKVPTLPTERKRYLSSRFSGSKLLNDRKKSHMFSPLKQTRRLKIRNLRKRFEQKKENPVSKRAMFLRNASKQTLNLMERKRSPRRCSSVVAQGAYREDGESELKIDRRKRKISNVTKPTKEESESEKTSKKKVADASDIEDDIRKIMSASKVTIDVKSMKNELESKIAKSADVKINSKANLDSKSIKSTVDNRAVKSNSDIKGNASGTEDGKNNDNGIEAEKVKCKEEYDDKKVERVQNIEADLEKIRTNTPDMVQEESPEEDSVKEKNHKTSNLVAKSRVGREKKKKIKPPMNIIRRRGRPRLSESNASPKEFKDYSAFSLQPQVPFLQNSFCFDVAPKLSKCRECRIALHRNNRKMYNSYCRFMEYRKLCFNKSGLILSAGFSNPTDATSEHLSQWLPQPTDPPKDLNFETAKSLLEHIGDQFCDLIEQEKEALSLHIGLHQVMTWKRIVQGVREMCDVCSTTIFNIHWVCPICGFAVCIDCYKVRKQGLVVEDDDDPRDRDEFKWLLCTLRQPHAQDSLVMAQMIPGKALWIMRDLLHKARIKWKIPSYCKCNTQKISAPDQLISTGINKQIMSCVTKSFTNEKNYWLNFDRSASKNDLNYDDLDVEVSGPALRWLGGNDINSDSFNNNLKILDENFNSYEDLLAGDLLRAKTENVPDFEYETTSFSLDDIITSVIKCAGKESSEKSMIKHFSHRYPQPISGRDPLPIRIYTKIESELAFSDVPHSWFCNGRLLFLHKADHKDNLALFQEQWKRGQPILVKGVQEGLDMSLWTPEGFCRDFGDVRNDLVDCKTGAVLKNLPMRKFWEGFENFSKRLTDESGEYMLLKLKDWPPGEDFSEKLPTRFDDLMKGLPLPGYTHRNGIFNLAGRLPPSFVRPDLGPKMYNAYGSALYPAKGTTNLHLDVSDAVNVMVYVGIPSDGNADLHIQEALKAIDEGGCDSLMRSRVRHRDAKPGALWHIYNARDADKIRDMLTKVAIERGEKLEAHHDPIHDQSWYIDSELRLRLYRDYGVEGYAIAQCLGDAVFIPAGAPHQVRNLHSCVKVAEDFVSPENIAHCFKLTQEFRNLSDTHTNHEDKLQIKNIIYHVVRDSLSHLLPETEPSS